MLHIKKYIPLLVFCIFFAKEKNSEDVQSDINYRNNELSIIKQEIRDVEENLIEKTKEQISTKELLINLESKIKLTEKLLLSINKGIYQINSKISEKEKQISKKQNELIKIRSELKSRLVHLYKHGKPSILENLFSSSNWNDAIYKTKYLHTLSINERKLQSQIIGIINDLDVQKAQLKKEINYKKELKSNKQNENYTLQNDKQKRESILIKLKKEKSTLEIELIKKQQMMSAIEKIISDLFEDKERIIEKENELARIRELQKMKTEGNFLKMKGELPWPIDGKIISQFGTIKNKELNTVTENLGIDIKAKYNNDVTSILDGIVKTITYIRGHGNVLLISHGDGFFTVYAKMERILVDENDYVQSGTILGNVDTDTKILHFEIWNNKKKLNPKKWLKKK